MKVFISYSSKDRERFVDEFAKRLNEKNIEVWYDKWELSYGDSLAKIFDDMLKCDYCISIISKNSINSKWVKEECDSAFIAKINGKLKFIPLIIMEDNITIPERFDYLRQCQIHNINDYDEKFNTLVSDILGISKKPKLGNSPNYMKFNNISGFNLFDSIVIKSLGDVMMEYGFVSLDFNYLMEKINDVDISKEDIKESVEILESEGIINFQKYLGCYYPEHITLTSYGVITYAEKYYPNYSDNLKKIASVLLNKEYPIEDNDFKNINAPSVIILSILDNFSTYGYLTLHKFLDGSFLVDQINAKGKRELKNIIN